MEEKLVWLVILIAGVVVLFGVLFWLQFKIEPANRADTDDWLKKGYRDRE